MSGKEGRVARGACVCGAVRIEIGVPARWAWHDHARRSRHAQGAAYVTYVGCWRSRFAIVEGEENVTRYEDEAEGTVRSFCARCGTPIAYERARSPQMVNVPRALVSERTGREPRYHMNMPEAAEWTWRGEALKPLKGYPGVLWEPPRRKKKPPEPMF
ncbi:GFA family protein [Phenylobacterium sp.]|uniref:GFA family protein n=1 Tax=Phenylobacterium sp. TaxID=1871053 RepID=UPI00260151E0|nr:GFA family protein [Phenylobacterium sp.]MBX3485950.1 GFA family protein [Phenylobacterium sp.]MCW5760923.1 GFA family protein [Phenylobacterium sp.]